MYLGIDLGTSSVKAVLVDHAQNVVAQASVALTCQRPHPNWSEQDPERWWEAMDQAVRVIAQTVGDSMLEVRAIGLSGQMHGATLLDDGDRVLRPAILWNDGRSFDECRDLTRRAPQLAAVSGNLAMPGFTAPKLLWVARHEPEVFSRVARVLLPKDYLRLRMCGTYATDMSDAAGTLWLDVAKRAWSDELLSLTELTQSHMPELYEGSETTGTALDAVAARWGLRKGVVVAAGAGDNAAGAIGVGVVKPGQGLISLGTSGTYFVSSAAFTPNPEAAVHAFCHALPDTWHQMSVVLSAASCIDWCAKLCGFESASDCLREAGATPAPRNVPVFLPYLAGERTPHNDSHARGVFFGLDHDTDRVALVRSVLEGICFAMADGERALLSGGTRIDDVLVIGGGTKSQLLLQLLASTLNRGLGVADDAALGPAFGAARLARLSAGDGDMHDVCTRPALAQSIEPDPTLVAPLAERYARYRALYPALQSTFAHAGVSA